jgi:LPXTG-motif cell wall-anchored protein
MQINRYFRGATAIAAGGCASFALATAAFAAPVLTEAVPINPGNVPTTAEDYEQECGENLGGGPYAGKDVWVFNLPGNADKTGAFLSITASFDTDGDGAGDQTVIIEAGAADGDDIVSLGHSKAYAITTAGWTLVGATATITGQAEKFVLTHTCAATAPPTSTPPTTTPATTTPATTTPATTTPATTTPSTTTPTATVDTTPSPTETPTVSPTPPPGTGTGGGLPLTGAAVSSVAALGVALVGGGAVLLMRRRRRFIA